MTASSQQQEPLQERLKEQVSVSVKEALEKTSSILSNLHRVQSYLYVLNTVPSVPGNQGLKNALQQVSEKYIILFLDCFSSSHMIMKLAVHAH